MRKLLAPVVLVALVSPTLAADPKPQDAPKKGPALKVGDKAPPLRATKWLQGSEVKAFAPGQTYVVEFWTTWCGPCIVMMPHTADLHAEYKDKGVTFIGFSAKDPNNSLERVQELVERRGPKLGYTFAYADNAETFDAWMTAGRGGFPRAFVVDGTGTIAYAGQPVFLGMVLPKVIAGKWTTADAAELQRIETEAALVQYSFRDPEPEVGLKALAAFESKYPKLVGIPFFNGPRIELLLKTKQTGAARKCAEALVARGIRTDDPTLLTMVSNVVRSPSAGGDKALLALSLSAAEGALKMTGDKDILVLLTVAQAHFANGGVAQAKAFGARAAAAAEKEPDFIKKTVENEVRKFDDGKTGK